MVPAGTSNPDSEKLNKSINHLYVLAEELEEHEIFI